MEVHLLVFAVPHLILSIRHRKAAVEKKSKGGAMNYPTAVGVHDLILYNPNGVPKILGSSSVDKPPFPSDTCLVDNAINSYNLYRNTHCFQYVHMYQPCCVGL